jgi:hypothetical protein
LIHSENYGDHAVKQRINLLRSVCHGITNIGVHVLHDCVISLEEQLVLSLGLNFIPAPRKRLNITLSEALDKFKRRVRIKKHFAMQPDSTSLDNSSFLPLSNSNNHNTNNTNFSHHQINKLFFIQR